MADDSLPQNLLLSQVFDAFQQYVCLSLLAMRCNRSHDEYSHVLTLIHQVLVLCNQVLEECRIPELKYLADKHLNTLNRWLEGLATTE